VSTNHHPNPDETPETLAEAVDRLTAAGYTESLASDGVCLVTPDGQAFEIDDLEVEEVVRFEGDTDPADESIVIALHCPKSGLRGTYVAAYGSQASPRNATILTKLARHLDERTGGHRHGSVH
jgi:hypothetical protein